LHFMRCTDNVAALCKRIKSRVKKAQKVNLDGEEMRQNPLQKPLVWIQGERALGVSFAGTPLYSRGGGRGNASPLKREREENYRKCGNSIATHARIARGKKGSKTFR